MNKVGLKFEWEMDVMWKLCWNISIGGRNKFG